MRILPKCEREILFHGKDKDGKWREGFFFSWYSDAADQDVSVIIVGDFHFLKNGAVPDYNYFEVDSKTVGQYINTDINKKKLFEHDIVEVKLPDVSFSNDKVTSEVVTIIGVIQWMDSNKSFSICEYKSIEDFKNGEIWDYHSINDDLQIRKIGNVFDNIELLNNKGEL